jgi:hypothetical protein
MKKPSTMKRNFMLTQKQLVDRETLTDKTENGQQKTSDSFNNIEMRVDIP